MLVFGVPVLLFVLDRRRIARSPLRQAAFKGLVLYALLCLSDGALDNIPVMAFYWFVYMVFLEGWPGGLDLVAPVPLAANRISRNAEVAPKALCTIPVAGDMGLQT